MARRKRSGGGGLSRRAALALIGGGGILGVVGTGAVDQVDANRKSTVNTVDDKSALLKLVGFDVDEAEEPHRITVTNQFGGKLKGEIRIDRKSLEFNSNPDNEIELEPGVPYEFCIVTPSYNDDKGSGEGSEGGGGDFPGNGPPGNGEENGEENGETNVPACEKEDESKEPKKCEDNNTSGTATIIFDFSGEKNDVVVEREITVVSS